LTAPPLVTSCVFKDDVDQGTTQDKKNMCWKNNLEYLEKMEEYRVHDTNHEGFNHNSLNRSLHLLYVHIINMSRTPIIIGVVILMVLCLISSVTYAMMGGEETTSTVTPASTPASTPAPKSATVTPAPKPAPTPATVTPAPKPAPTPAPVPTYKLRDAKTPANDWGGGNAIFLDRHTLDCGDDGLNQFKLGRPSTNRIQYSYKCLEGINSPANIKKDTGANDWGGGNTIFLDRHNVDCGKNPITKFRLVRPAGNKIRYDYTCNSKKVSGACRDVNTGWNQESDKNIYLDRHNVKCNSNEVITQFKLNRDGKGKFRYDYKCCKM
jgi:hypothetical protein